MKAAICSSKNRSFALIRNANAGKLSGSGGSKCSFLTRSRSSTAMGKLPPVIAGPGVGVGVGVGLGKENRIGTVLGSVSGYLDSQSRCHSSYQYEYPTRTEAPSITRTVASNLNLKEYDNDILESTEAMSNSTPNSTKKGKTTSDFTEQFDDFASVAPEERQPMNNKLPDSFVIQSHPPKHIPPNLPREALSTPKTEVSTLDNGIRVASQETYGQVCSFGLISNCGSRLETDQNLGTNHLMELLAFSGTNKISSADYQSKLDTLGGVSFASSSREQFLYCIDVLRPNIDEAMDMMKDAILNPSINEMAVQEVKRIIEFQWMDIMPEILLNEGLQVAAYGPIDGISQQLGRSHFCPLEALPKLNAQIISDFRNKYLLNPKSMVIAGAGIQHDHLVSLAQQHFGHIKTKINENTSRSDNDSGNSNGIVPSTYTGGSYRHNMQTPDGFTRVALAFPTEGWHSDDLVPACVLQTLLGGGNSFSAGGPGKGMYSRLYRQVLNRYYWAESCEAFTSFHTESGLIGISGSAIPSKAGDMTRVLAENMMRLAVDLVDDEELDRARNMLKCNVLTQLESRLVLFEDMGRQVLTYDKREDSQEMCKKIDAVTKESLRDLAKSSIRQMKPTICSVGDDISQVPTYDDVEYWFKSF